MVWTNAMDSMAYLLIFHESLWMGNKLDHTLVNPNQLQAYGVSVQDNPFNTNPLSITRDGASVKLYWDDHLWGHSDANRIRAGPTTTAHP